MLARRVVCMLVRRCAETRELESTYLCLFMLHDSHFPKCTFPYCSQEIKVVEIHRAVEVNDL